MFKNLVIFAAGNGGRMFPLTAYTPKAMVLCNNKTLIQASIEKFSKKNFKIHVTVGHKGDELAKHVISLGVSTVINTTGKGNAWWVYNSILSSFDEPIIALTCDSLMDVDLEALEKNYLNYKKPLCMLLPAKPIETIEGDYIHQENGLVKYLSRKDKTDIYASGCQVLNPKKIIENTKSTDNFSNLWEQLIELNQLFCTDFNASNWFSVDTIEQLKLYDSFKKKD